jgi:hypothetical protein
MRQRTEALMLRGHFDESGETALLPNTTPYGVALPCAGAFVLEVDLQLNVPANLYMVQSLVWAVA